jgi:hypothetical protein
MGFALILHPLRKPSPRHLLDLERVPALCAPDCAPDCSCSECAPPSTQRRPPRHPLRTSRLTRVAARTTRIASAMPSDPPAMHVAPFCTMPQAHMPARPCGATTRARALASSRADAMPDDEEEPLVMQIDRFRVEHGDGFSFPCFHLANRRAAGDPITRWICQRHLYVSLSDAISCSVLAPLLTPPHPPRAQRDSALQSR